MFLLLHTLLLYCNNADVEHNINIYQFIEYKTNKKQHKALTKLLLQKQNYVKTVKIVE